MMHPNGSFALSHMGIESADGCGLRYEDGQPCLELNWYLDHDETDVTGDMLHRQLVELEDDHVLELLSFERVGYYYVARLRFTPYGEALATVLMYESEKE